MKRMLFLISSFVLAMGITACGNNNNNNDAGGGSSSKGGGGNVDAAAAKQVYKKNCASCHGQNLEGKNGPNLQKIGGSMSKADILKQIKNGGGGMPGGLIKGKDAQNVAGWLASKK